MRVTFGKRLKAPGRKDLLDKLRPSLVSQMRLWWDLVSEDGYGYNWGRSQGIVSYLDTPEIAGFLGAHPEFRPAPLAEIAAHYYQAWRYLRGDFRDNAHLLSLFAFGRGNYAYITSRARMATDHGVLRQARQLAHNPDGCPRPRRCDFFPTVPTLSRVARFEFFRKNTERSAGVWLVRQGALRFALPITTGPKPGVADYLPAPYGLAGFAAPVEQVYPALTPYLELEDGRTIVATDGADLIEPSLNGQTLHVRWNRWALVGAKPGELVDVGLTSDVLWSIKNNTLTREEILTAKQPLNVRRWKLAVPTTHANLETSSSNNVRVDRFSSNEGSLEVKMLSASFPVVTRVFATGDSPLGRGVRGAIPLHLVFESSNLRLQPGKPIRYELALTVNGNSTVGKNQVTH